MRRAAP